jgi:hypothetical protein
MGAKRNHVGILKKLWVLAKLIIQNPNKLKENLFLAKDNQRFTSGNMQHEMAY